jgi:hypothetical protein
VAINEYDSLNIEVVLYRASEKYYYPLATTIVVERGINIRTSKVKEHRYY